MLIFVHYHPSGAVRWASLRTQMHPWSDGKFAIPLGSPEKVPAGFASKYEGLARSRNDLDAADVRSVTETRS